MLEQSFQSVDLSGTHRSPQAKHWGKCGCHYEHANLRSQTETPNYEIGPTVAGGLALQIEPTILAGVVALVQCVPNPGARLQEWRLVCSFAQVGVNVDEVLT